MSESNPLEKCDVLLFQVMRARIVGPSDLRNAVLEYLHDEGYDVTRSGAYTDREMFPKADVSRFLVIAERVPTDSDPSMNALRVLKIRTGRTPNGAAYVWIEDAPDLESYCYSAHSDLDCSEEQLLGTMIGELSCSGEVDLKSCGIDYEGNETVTTEVINRVSCQYEPD